MIDNTFSRKIKVLSFLAMVTVVMIHSHALGTFENAVPWCLFVQKFLFRTITSWAVPFFFVISGYFFARGAYFIQGAEYRWFIAKKVQTLLLPYLLWVIIGTAISMPLIMGNNYMMHRGLFERTFLANGFGWKALDSFLCITSNGPSGNLALWYVRTLLIFFALAPIWKFVLKLNNMLTVACGLLLVVFGSELWIPFTGLKYGSFGWLFLGVGIAEFGVERIRFPRWLVIVFGCIYIALSVYVASCGVDCYAMVPLSGVLFWWGLYDWLMSSYRHLPACLSMTFWVYCLHGVVTGWFLAGTLFVLGKTNASAMIASFASIFGALAISFAAGYYVKKMLPRFYNVLTGGRG